MANLEQSLSGTESSITKSAKVTINKEKCKGCGYCVEFCPRGALIMTTEINAKGYSPAALADETKCSTCGFCEIICPEFTIKVNRKKPQ